MTQIEMIYTNNQDLGQHQGHLATIKHFQVRAKDLETFELVVRTKNVKNTKFISKLFKYFKLQLVLDLMAHSILTYHSHLHLISIIFLSVPIQISQ